jgi:hypothetical protein
MRDNRIVAPPARARVQGLGLCDALRVELEPGQIAGVIDELEERRGPLHEAFENARARWDALAGHERTGQRANELERDLSASAYALEVSSALRAQLPARGGDAPVVMVGPASTMADIVTACARNAVDELAALIGRSPGADESAHRQLLAAATTVSAWVATFIECEAVVGFNFDDDWDPVQCVV